MNRVIGTEISSAKMIMFMTVRTLCLYNRGLAAAHRT